MKKFILILLLFIPSLAKGAETVEQKLAVQIGQLIIQNASLATQIEQLKETIENLKKQIPDKDKN